ncbi:MAG TPA: segregation/condensation protein A [Clostridiales bacterium]|mgnify:CR=1 FL=1|nr:segregation/condensation protein A [Clostridiales bacterium]
MISSLTNGCKIKVGNFEGPFDLLFHLIEKNKIDIYDIPIGEITDQYMDYLFAMQKMDLELASEFLVMAATLLHIKSRVLLPPEKDKEKEEESDPREELVIKLIEYKKYKEVSLQLQKRETEWSKFYYKSPENIEAKDVKQKLDLNLDNFREAYLNLMKKNRLKENNRTQEIQQILQKDKVSIKSKIKHIMNILLSKKQFVFTDVFPFREKSLTEIVTAFLALLVVVKSGKAAVYQKKQYSDIIVEHQDS